MKWRQGKHLQQHESSDAKYCHYFNNDEQVDKSVDTDNDVDDDEGLQDKQDDARTTQVWRCDYGRCDLQQILFKTKEDLKTHLENQHGIYQSEQQRKSIKKQKFKENKL